MLTPEQHLIKRTLYRLREMEDVDNKRITCDLAYYAIQRFLEGSIHE